MEFFNTIAGIIITLAAVLGALITMVTFLKNGIKRWNDKRRAAEEMTKNLCDVKAEFAAMKVELKAGNDTRDALLAKVVKSNDDIKKRINVNETDRIRWEILNFANMCRRQVRTNLDEFNHIIGLYQKYHDLLEEDGRENGQIALEYEYISRIYMKLSENDQFSKD